MGKPAARVGDMHVCPMMTPGVPPIPHVGGPLLPPGAPTVLIGGMPAAVMGGMATCVGPPDSVVLGSMGVMIGGQPAARMGDMCAHGGTIVLGLPTVLIGEMMPGVPPVVVVPAVVLVAKTAEAKTSGQAQALTEAAKRGTPFCEVCEQAKQEEEEQQAKKEEEKTFVEVEVVDSENQPVPGEKYEIQLLDGTKKKGVTDSRGRIRLDEVDLGEYKIMFPDLDANDWEQA